jgi:hypothetical protein
LQNTHELISKVFATSSDVTDKSVDA